MKCPANKLLSSIYSQGWANYGPLGNLTGPLALIDCTFSYVYLLCVLLENPINLSTKQLEYKMHETSVFVRTFRPFQSLGIIMWPPQKKDCPPLIYTIKTQLKCIYVCAYIYICLYVQN